MGVTLSANTFLFGCIILCILISDLIVVNARGNKKVISVKVMKEIYTCVKGRTICEPKDQKVKRIPLQPIQLTDVVKGTEVFHKLKGVLNLDEHKEEINAIKYKANNNGKVGVKEIENSAEQVHFAKKNRWNNYYIYVSINRKVPIFINKKPPEHHVLVLENAAQEHLISRAVHKELAEKLGAHEKIKEIRRDNVLGIVIHANGERYLKTHTDMKLFVETEVQNVKDGDGKNSHHAAVAGSDDVHEHHGRPNVHNAQAADERNGVGLGEHHGRQDSSADKNPGTKDRLSALNSPDEINKNHANYSPHIKERLKALNSR